MDGEQQSLSETTVRAMTLIKGGHSWRFEWSEGDERTLLHALADLAEKQTGGFEWFDAAVVSHTLGRRLAAGLHKFSAD